MILYVRNISLFLSSHLSVNHVLCNIFMQPTGPYLLKHHIRHQNEFFKGESKVGVPV
jgi:hypothetical protein